MNCGKVLKILLEDGNFTQTDLAVAIGYSQRAVSKWVNEQAEPTETAICMIAEFFGVSTDYLLGRTDELGAVTSVPAVLQFSEEDREILSLFHALTPEYQAVALNTLRSWADVPTAGSSIKKV